MKDAGNCTEFLINTYCLKSDKKGNLEFPHITQHIYKIGAKSNVKLQLPRKDFIGS